ncbi:dimethyl sulfoxide reductase anchor subunit family protein [Marinobacterium arenosum]|uniref:dimethyl sulfoxide reductase anchor subunit family protein n=1 Tax=Marinobacterium arenosum TaxID=2862496 RepID=UPI001C95AD39|nr:DmsC/YnfH family molybdoenzyme membrane anchor subunit [Marinobacterium arenosum]MBY4677166.1 dimethyl sulfoxide reductase anchor subunit [Marinobacterium arenosum]
MHPAFSVLVFTVLSGAGYGLISLLVLAHLAGIPQLQDTAVLLAGGLLAFLLITGGLLSSTLHLANPKNAWRAFSRFRTSWLSREAVFAVLFYPFLLLYLFGIYRQGAELGALFKLAGILAATLALVTLFCTSMIYASLKTIRQWNSALTPLNYLALGLMSGALLLAAVQAVAQGGLAAVLQQLALGLVLLGAVAKLIYLFWIGKPAGSTIHTATGFTQASVRLLDQGHTANSFLNDEFGYRVEAERLMKLRYLMVGLAFVLPFMLLLSGQAWLAPAASVLAIAGLLTERWLFFAEARHVVRLFHGEQHT